MKQKKILKVGKSHFQKTVYNPKGIAPTMREGHGDVIRILDSSTSSQELEDSTKECNKHPITARVPKDGIVPTLTVGNAHSNFQTPLINVSGQMNGTNTQQPYTKNNSQKHHSTKEISEQLTLMGCPTSTYSVEAFHAKLSALQEKEKDLTIQEARYFLKLLESSKPRDPRLCCLKTSKVFYLTNKEEHLEELSKYWETWGIGWNGRFLTARITESHKTGKECSLSDILETDVANKYFLSDKMCKRLMKTGQLLEHSQEEGIQEDCIPNQQALLKKEV